MLTSIKLTLSEKKITIRNALLGINISFQMQGKDFAYWSFLKTIKGIKSHRTEFAKNTFLLLDFPSVYEILLFLYLMSHIPPSIPL